MKNMIKKLFFLHSSPLIRLARSRILQEEDMLPLPESLNPATSDTVRLLPLDTTPLKFIMSLIRVYQNLNFKAYAYQLGALICTLSSPVLIHHFVSSLDQGSSWQTSAFWGAGLGLAGVLTGIFFQHFFYQTLAANQKISGDINQLIFRQSLELSVESRANKQLGDIVNHMNSDTDALADMPIIIGEFGWAFLTITTATGMLFYYIGWSAAPAILVLACLIPITKRLATRFVRYEEEMMNHKDARLTLMGQLLSQIRTIKYFAWEKAVTREVNTFRQAEVDSRRKLARAEIFSSISYIAVSSLVLFISLFTHAWRGIELDAATIFTCISLFGLLEDPFGHLSRHFSRFTQGLVSARRVLEFLNLPRVPKPLPSTLSSSNLAFELKNASFGYGQRPILKSLSLKLEKGQTLAVIGPVGAGKSTLLQALLNECPLLEGEVQLAADLNRKSYVPQEAFIVNSSLLENIVFGEEPLEKELLRKALHAAALEKDVRDLPAGLKTEIGEKGVNLSGGQKQRTSLARAFYSQPNLALLDDPLSAVDVETEKRLCERLIFGEWKERKVTQIVVTHRLEFLRNFDRILFLKEGRVSGFGTFEELLSSSHEFAAFYKDHLKSPTGLVEAPKTESRDTSLSEENTRITVDEEREKGAVKASVYLDYLLSLRGPARSNRVLTVLILVSVAAAVSPLIEKGWISNFQSWGFDLTPLQAVSIYGVLGLLVLGTNLLNSLYWVEKSIIAGQNFHDRMLGSVLKAPMRFFDSTPLGRVLQRFSRDLESVDLYMQWSFSSFIQCLLNVGVALVLVLVTLPWMILVLIPTLWIYHGVQQDYRRAAREAKRFDSISRSPRFAHFKTTLTGLPVIRAFGRRDWFLRDFFSRMSHSQRMFYGHYMLNRWFSCRVPVIAGMISVATLIGISFSAHQGLISPSAGGLVTIYALTFWAQLNWGIRIFADIESRMTSVERLKFYSNLETEKFEGSLDPRESWPEKGAVSVENLKVRFASHLPEVLKGVSFEIPGGSKVGIIGRTGSGKTTLFQTFYRFIEASEGRIRIDGVDISELPLERLRQSLAIVPQDPSLFLGTLRTNLDRYDEYSDEEIWKVLRQAGLSEMIRELPLKLATPVAENGANFSQGQKQLLCLARALLVGAKLILMDEATASVDIQTDQNIQKVIREGLQGVTLLIIAHRLATVADCDLVVEMADGKVVQTQRPNLLAASSVPELI